MAAVEVPPEKVPWQLAGSDVTSLIRGLQELYWSGLEIELRVMIITLAEFMQNCPEALPVEAIPSKPHPRRQDYFAKQWCM